MTTIQIDVRRSAADSIESLDVDLQNYALSKDWIDLGGMWMNRTGEVYELAEDVRRAIACEMQDDAPDLFVGLVEEYGDDVWRAIDGLPTTGCP